MIIHIFPYEKFAYDYIKKIDTLFNSKDHLFYIFGEKVEDCLDDITFDNVKIVKEKSMFLNLRLIKSMMLADQIIFHSLSFHSLFLLTCVVLLPILRCKYFWNIWGGDLYDEYWERKKHWKKEILKKIFVRYIKSVGYIPSDYDFLKKHYATKANFYLASYSYQFETITQNDYEDEHINILIGNSATETSQHYEIIDKLASYKDHGIMVYCILSYPKKSTDYRDSVIKYGRSKLGNQFVPITEFVEYAKYCMLLSKIDLAVFNHNRQQALGNIASLLYMGKRVYINPLNGCKDYFERMGATLYSTNDISDKEFYKGVNKDIALNNKEAIERFFSDERFARRWKNIFDISKVR